MNRHTRLLGSVAICFIVAGPLPAWAVSPATVSFASRLGNNTSFATSQEYVDNWNALPTNTPGYGDAAIAIWSLSNAVPVDNHDLIVGGSIQNLAYLYTVDFAVGPGEATDFKIQVAPDFGLGGTVLLDGAAVALNSGDIWFGLDWSNTSHIFDFNRFLDVGDHTMQVYGQEACCDGATAARFSTDGGVTWISFGATMPEVPEPTTTSLVAIGVLGLAFYRNWAQCE